VHCNEYAHIAGNFEISRATVSYALGFVELVRSKYSPLHFFSNTFALFNIVFLYVFLEKHGTDQQYVKSVLPEDGDGASPRNIVFKPVDVADGPRRLYCFMISYCI
jgi:hypothetical protein